MERLHALILIPYYFFAALAVLACLMVVCRLLRARLAINTLVGTAIALSLVLIIAPLALDWVDLAAFTTWPMVALGLVSFLAAGIDVALAKRLRAPFDKELQEI